MCDTGYAVRNLVAVKVLGLAHLIGRHFSAGTVSRCRHVAPGWRITSTLLPSIGINRVQADICDGGFDGKLWRGESFRQQKQGIKGLGDN